MSTSGGESPTEGEAGFREQLRREAEKRGVSLPEDSMLAMERHRTLLQQWGARINLVAAGDWNRLPERHYGEALGGVRWVQPEARSALDIGSGAGFPALPLSAALPEIHWTLLEPRVKRWAFLSQVVQETKLRCEVVNASLAAFVATAEKEFDLLTLRAVGNVPRLLETAAPLLARGARVLWFAAADEEPAVKGFRAVGFDRLHAGTAAGLWVLEWL